MKKQHSEEEIPGFLKDLKAKKDGFNLPEGYFNDMEDAVFARLKSSGDLDRPVVNVRRGGKMWASFIRPKAALAYAAALALVLAAVWFIRQSTQEFSQAPMVAVELSEEELETYLLENVHDFEPEQLASIEPDRVPELMDEQPTDQNNTSKRKQPEIHPDDLEEILDEMTDEELEQIL